MKDCGDSRALGWNLWFLLLLGIVFSVSFETMLFYNAITLRDILLDRMKVFTQGLFFSFFEFTLNTIEWFIYSLGRGITKSI